MQLRIQCQTPFKNDSYMYCPGILNLGAGYMYVPVQAQQPPKCARLSALAEILEGNGENDHANIIAET